VALGRNLCDTAVVGVFVANGCEVHVPTTARLLDDSEPCLWFKFWGQGAGFRVQGLGFRGLGCDEHVPCLGLRTQGLGWFSVSVLVDS
jgi:hypothetical protein